MRRAAALMILVAILAACTSSQSVPDAPPPAPVGDVLTLEASGRLTEQASLPEGPGNLSGAVRNMAGEPLRNVLLYVDPDHMTLSAEDGSYRFDALAPGEHTVSALSHTHIDALEGQTAFIFDQADITRDFHLSEGLSTNVAVRFLNESDEPLAGAVGFYRLDDLKLAAQVDSMGDEVNVAVPAGVYWVATFVAEGETPRGALLDLPPNRTREGVVRLFREPPRELEPATGSQVTVAGAMTPPDFCAATAFVVQAFDRDTGQSLGVVYSTDGAYEITFENTGSAGRFLLRYDAVCSRGLLATDALTLTLDAGVGGRLSHDVAFDTAQ